MSVTSITNRRIGPLKAIEIGEAKKGPTIVLFHGYGASGSDLAPVSAETPLDFPAHWIFPDAPNRTSFGGLAWFQIDEKAIEQAQQSGVAADFSNAEPSGFEEAKSAGIEFLKALNIPFEDMMIGGFSQGSMLATEIFLSQKENFKGLAIFSGNIINQKSLLSKAPLKKGLSFFQSHGIADPILGFSGARKLFDLLTESGLKGEFLKFEGGHTISLETLEAFGSWVDKIR